MIPAFFRSFYGRITAVPLGMLAGSHAASMKKRARLRKIVKDRVRASGSSFRAGMIILPRKRRSAMYALYAFCRDVDDIADNDSLAVQERLQQLKSWRDRIEALYDGLTTGYPLADALAEVIADYKLHKKDFIDVIDGMVMDLATPLVAPSWFTLDLYCDRVASAVGRLSVCIFGDASKAAFDVAHHLGRALQLTNILRDLAEDAMRGRLYLPRELLARHGIEQFTPDYVLRSPALSAVCCDVAARAAFHFESAEAAMRLCKRRAMRSARIMQMWYSRILEQLMVKQWHNPMQRVSLPRRTKILFMTQALLGLPFRNGAK